MNVMSTSGVESANTLTNRLSDDCLLIAVQKKKMILGSQAMMFPN